MFSLFFVFPIFLPRVLLPSHVKPLTTTRGPFVTWTWASTSHRLHRPLRSSLLPFLLGWILCLRVFNASVCWWLYGGLKFHHECLLCVILGFCLPPAPRCCSIDLPFFSFPISITFPFGAVIYYVSILGGEGCSEPVLTFAEEVWGKGCGAMVTNADIGFLPL